jgi:light-independent protochlorophyllide reductase subunit B
VGAFPLRISQDLYEGPGSHGVLRVAASLEGAHAVLRAYPDEGYFAALHGARTRSGDPAPVTTSLVRNEVGGSPEDDVRRDLLAAARGNPEAQAIVYARSEAALLSGEGVPEVGLPESPATGRPPVLVTCPWESPLLDEIEAADLALAELVKAHAKAPRGRSPAPSVNVFGPPLLGPNAEAEAQEMERLMGLLGVEVNARVPLGASVGELAGLPRAWANVVLYREVGDEATLFLQDEFGMPRVTTPALGSAGTGSILRAVGELCSLDPQRVQRAVWAELARTAKLPWYARLAVPETFRGRRVALFGDFTYPLGLGYTLAREVGLEVAWAGTYLVHLEKDFLFHAGTFTDDAFVADDPDAVAARVEEAAPDLLVGTHLEAEVAEALGIPFLPLCPPVVERPFVERPLMGYAGSSVLADALEAALREPPSDQPPPEARGPDWTEEALEELEEVPAFLRGRARRLAEERARAVGSREVTPEILEESRL